MPSNRDPLFEISAVIRSTRDLETLEKKLLEVISRSISADRGAILLLGEGGEHFASVCGWDSRGDVDRPVAYSRTIIDRVLRDKAPVVFFNGNEITAAIAVPLLVYQKMRGVLYLDTTA